MGNYFVVRMCIHLSASIMNLLWIKLYLAYLWKSVWSFLAEQKTITLIFMDLIFWDSHMWLVCLQNILFCWYRKGLKMLFSWPLMFKEAKELAAWIVFSYLYAELITKIPSWHNMLIMSSRAKVCALFFRGHKKHLSLTKHNG